MQKKRILFGQEARNKIRAGETNIADAVRVTMGARGRTVGLSYGHFTKDGVSVARDVELEDEFENKGAQLLRAASIKTCDVVGDGTTLTCVIGSSLVNGGFDMIEQGKDAQELRRELETLKPEVLKLIEKQARTVKDVEQVATISANDENVGRVVAQAVNAVGADGLVSVESAYVSEDEVEIVDGMQMDKGVAYPVFYTDPTRKRAEYQDPAVIVFDGDVHDVQGFFGMLTPLFNKGSAILVIANAFDDQILHSMALNRIKFGVKIVPVISPHIYREEVLEDIAIYTGARVLKETDALDKVDVYEIVGNAASVTSTPERTVIRAAKGHEKAVKSRIAYIKEHAKSYRESERREVEKRAARLSGMSAVIRTHSTTEEEAKEKRDRFDDAIYAAQSALKEGVVTGGGMTLVRVAQQLKGETDGTKLIKQVLEAPIRQIAQNAGRNLQEVMKHARNGEGYNAKTDSFGDLDKMGVVDPAAVLKYAFENALSVSILAITTETLIQLVEVKEKKD
jgi:chaperonin GroEL